MPVLSSDTLSLVDYILLLIVLIGLPLNSWLGRARIRKLIREGARRRLYWQTIILLWALTLPILLIWPVGGRSWADLGFRVEAGWLSLTGWALAAVACGLVLWQFLAVRASPANRQQVLKQLKKTGELYGFMPQTREEYRLFRLTGITAGITEEIVFRGYLFWALGLVMPLWLAAAVSLAVFVFMHNYQGMANLGPVFLMGGVLTAVVLLTGSLWPAIALHIFVDVINNDMVRAARQAESTGPDA